MPSVRLLFFTSLRPSAPAPSKKGPAQGSYFYKFFFSLVSIFLFIFNRSKREFLHISFNRKGIENEKGWSKSDSVLILFINFFYFLNLIKMNFYIIKLNHAVAESYNTPFWNISFIEIMYLSTPELSYSFCIKWVSIQNFID